MQGNNNGEIQYTIFSGVDFIDTTINVENISFDQDLVNSSNAELEFLGLNEGEDNSILGL